MTKFTVQDHLILITFSISLYGFKFASSLCSMPNPGANYQNRVYKQLCIPVDYLQIWSDCRTLNSYPVDLESLQNVMFLIPGITQEYWVGPGYAEILEDDFKYLSYNGKTVKVNGETVRYEALCEQVVPLSSVPVPPVVKQNFNKAVCSTESCYVQIPGKKKSRQAAIDNCKDNQLNLVKLESWAEFEFIENELKVSKFWVDVPIDSNTNLVVKSKNGKTILSVICELSYLPTTKSLPVSSSTESRNIDTSTISSLNVTVRKDGATEGFECPNGKMWKTSNLTRRGDKCLTTTVRSKLECIVISQQQKCPYVFYQREKSTCQLFYHKLSNSSALENLDCDNNHCYTCV